ncbi:hypothetical protein [Desulfopila sp. IMCC35008]|uniref:hypothetical protein n=1 Tax=Desulfopila sp. IMCC35008 TaxID=2653858 RepID=UPI0013D73B3B|nr:hypothetical protein [Desulfopila sp. IMCC35008]
MIQSTQLPIVPPANSAAILKRDAENNEAGQGFQDILGQTTTDETTATPPVVNNGAADGTNTSNLAPYLYELLGNTKPASVNEEQLFAGIVHERLIAAKGEEAANAYDVALEKQMGSHERADGYVFMEDAARAALRDLEQQGILTLEEAETIHAQAFQASQLDSNKNALYDSYGTTQSVASTESAMESALATLLKFDSGELESGRMSLSFTQGQQAGSSVAGTAATSGTTDSMTAAGLVAGSTVLTGTQADISGIRWNPVSKGVGKLAVVLPSALQDVEQVYVTDTQGNIAEKGFLASEDKGRHVFRFNGKGGSYPSPSILHVEMGDGKLYQFEINSPGSMTTDVKPYVS